MGKGHFRVLGRDRFAARAEHRLFNLATLRFRCDLPAWAQKTKNFAALDVG